MNKAKSFIFGLFTGIISTIILGIIYLIFFAHLTIK